ncbi:MAG: sporulation peptidase YabG [Haloplasmataceae bacterium]|jgi:spore coat assembly protein|nr:sporulation peptidase YabG [Haloplasmataceae bacterium]
MFNIGDMVGRISYNFDIIFEIVEINDNIATIVGKTIRLVADSPLDDLKIIDDEVLLREDKKEDDVIEDITNQVVKKNRKKFLTGKILHIDGDEKYMRKCLDLYQKVGIYAVGIEIKEKDMPKIILKYIKFLKPDIVVITGHDAYNKSDKELIDNYRNTKYFVEAINLIRSHYPVLNQPIIIAGACQSHFEALIGAGANFASSPSRVNIQSLDPAIIAIKCSSTSINELIKVYEAIEKTSNKNEGIGGIESFGTMRTLYY